MLFLGTQLFAQSGWDFDHGAHEVSISTNGWMQREEELLSLSDGGNGTLDIPFYNMSLTVMEDHDLLVGRERSPVESVLRLFIRRPYFLTREDVAGDWILVEFLIEEHADGLDIHAFEIDSANVSIDTAGKVALGLDSEGSYSINSRNHLIVSLEGELFDFGVLASKDLMVSTSSSAGSHALRLLVRPDSSGQAEQLEGDWTLHSFGVDNGILDHWFDREDFHVSGEGTALMIDGLLVLTAHGNGLVTFVHGNDSGELICNRSGNLLVYGHSHFTENQLHLVVRRPAQVVLADLAGTWDVYEIEVSGEVDLSDGDDDGLPDVWEKVNFGDLTRDGTEDLDKDGFSDRLEYLVNTSPRNPSLYSTPLEPDLTWEGNFILWVQTVAGRYYQVQISFDLQEWEDRVRFYANGSLQGLSLPGPYQAKPTWFYRFRVEDY